MNSAEPSNMRTALDWKDGYNLINREERNLSAILYHILLQKDNLAKFLQLIECPFPVLRQETGIYFEYAFLRDLWAYKNHGNDRRRSVILAQLKASNGPELERMSILEFNTYFGAVPQPSADFIQSPGNWSISRFRSTISDNTAFLNACKFKWSFNAKPDIVIHTSHDSAVCIEAKFESGEGSYPTKPDEIREFDKRGIVKVGQTELQKYIMEDLLGIRTQFIFLVQQPSAKSATHKTMVWKDVFRALDTSDCAPFIEQWFNRL